MGAYPSVKMTNSGNSSIITINPTSAYSPFFGPTPSWNLGIICTVSSGANLTYTIQITADQTPSSSGNWNDHDSLVNLTSSANGNVSAPITGLRIKVSSYVSGSINLGVAQWP